MHSITLPSAALLALFLWTAPAADAAFEPPPNDGYVTDAAGILSDAEEQELEEMLQAYQRETTNEIAVLTVTTLDGDPIADAAVETGRAWGVGSQEDNGILLLVSYEEREMFLAVGYGLEGAVPDIVAHGIIEEDIVPAFRDGAYAEGIQTAVISLQKHIGGEYTAERYEQNSKSGGAWAWIFFLVFIAFDFLVAVFARTKSWWLGGIVGSLFGIILTILYGWWISIPVLVILGLLFDYIVSKRGRTGVVRRRGGPFGGFGRGGQGGGGGFGGFGGGSFGGGGASGRW